MGKFQNIAYNGFNVYQKQLEDSRQKMSHSPNANHIVHFFLDLYRRQIGLPEMDPGSMTAKVIDIDNKSNNITYEFKVFYAGKNKTRRMSLCRLGEEVESKSTCYKVIYDDLLVLKIPPKPLTDFEKYLKSIELEREITYRLGPEIPCVSPSLSAILNKNPEFQNHDDLGPEAYEESVTRRLRERPELQGHLKIRGTFVLFMGLSNHFFLNQILERMHQNDARLRDTIAKSCDCMGDILAFETSYGNGKEALFYRFASLQESYVAAMNHLLERYGRESQEIPEQQKRQWMFDQLSGREISCDRARFPEDFPIEQRAVGKEILSQHKKELHAFISLLKEDIQKTAQNRNREIAKGLIANILTLLFFLRKKKAAVRDMKPDNMFLKGNSEDPDHFLASADAYKMGLIDLETSVNTVEIETGQQPVLAGTPLFATPSHLFENGVLKAVFRDVPRTFYLQDWYAAIGMIFNVVTGRTLFEKTSRLLPEVVRVRSKAKKNEESLPGILKNVSWVFWHTACLEFKEQLSTWQSVFKEITFSPGGAERGMLLSEIAVGEHLLLAQIERLVGQQTFFKEEKTQQSIIEAPLKRINATLTKWADEKGSKNITPEVKMGVVSFLRRVAHLKKCNEGLLQLRPVFQSETASVNAWHLVSLMFRLVFCFMFRPEWTDRTPPESP